MNTIFNNIGDVYLLLLVTYVITIIAVLTGTVHEMAKLRGRSAGAWVFFSIMIANPLIVMFCLLCLGETNEKRRQRILDDENYIKTWRD